MKTCSRCNQQKEEREFQIRRASTMDFQQHVKPAYQITIAVEQTFPSELRLALSTKNLTEEKPEAMLQKSGSH
jgi:hypothetical protein